MPLFDNKVSASLVLQVLCQARVRENTALAFPRTPSRSEGHPCVRDA